MSIAVNEATVPTDIVDPGFRATLRSEWDKALTARAPRRNLILGTVLGIALSLLLSVTVGATFDEWSAADQASFDPIVFPLSGSLLLAIFYVAAVVGLVVPEYTSGMIRLTLYATPRRGRVLAAKVLVATIATGIGTIVALAGMVWGSQLVYAANDLPTVDVGDGDLWRTLTMLVITGPLFPALAVAIAFLLRSAAAAVASALALIFAPSMFGGLLPDWWERNIISLLPGPAADSLALGHVQDSPQYLQPLPAALVVAVWTVGLLAIARRSLWARDA